MEYNYEGADQIQEYSGVPNIQNAREKALVAGFVEILIKTISADLKNQGGLNLLSDLISSETELRKAQAKKENAYADLIKANALKMMQDIAEQAARMEQEKLKMTPITGNSADLVKDFNALQEKVKIMEITYGLNLAINLVK